jgi:hypothetical protein
MRQAIVTKYMPATATKPSRVMAKCAGGHVVVSWSHDMNVDENNFHAAMRLVHKMQWFGPNFSGHWVAGGLPDGNGNVYVYNDFDTTTQFRIDGP